MALSKLGVAKPPSETGSDISLNLSPDLKFPKRPPPEGITFLKLAVCKSCKHESNEPNPLVDSVRASNEADCPCWPWLYGDHKLPEGRQCKLCPFAHRIAGYPGTLDDTLNAQKGSLEKTAEWFGVLRFVIDNINAGKMKLVMRVKGAKKKGCWMCSTMSSSVQSRCSGPFGWL